MKFKITAGFLFITLAFLGLINYFFSGDTFNQHLFSIAILIPTALTIWAIFYKGSRFFFPIIMLIFAVPSYAALYFSGIGCIDTGLPCLAKINQGIIIYFTFLILSILCTQIHKSQKKGFLF